MGTRLIISSNYPGLGKDTLLKNLELEIGVKSLHMRVGDLIKERAYNIINMINNQDSLGKIADEFTIDSEMLETTVSLFTSEEIQDNNPNIKTIGQRQLQQDLGLKFYSDEYWADQLEIKILENRDNQFIASAGVRLPIEADMFNSNGFFHIRINGTKELARERIWERDKTKISDEQLDHPVERALDDYDKFNIILEADMAPLKMVEKTLDAYMLVKS